MTDLPIMYHDDAIVVLNKPSGLLAVPGLGADKADCLASRVQARFPSASVVHRLDRDTSGLMVMARSPEAHRHLSSQFEHRRVTKRYRAIVHPAPARAAGTIELPLRKDMQRKFRHIVDPIQGKPAFTHWKLVAIGDRRAMLELEPITGRSHQLRVHLSHIGHPIVGDRLYGGDAGERLMLHATQLSCVHPISEQQLEFESSEPFALV